MVAPAFVIAPILPRLAAIGLCRLARRGPAVLVPVGRRQAAMGTPSPPPPPLSGSPPSPHTPVAPPPPAASSPSSSAASLPPPPSGAPLGKRRRPTAAAIIIGDEVLTGKVLDTNSHHLARALFGAGVSLSHIEVIPDVPATITAAVARLSAAHTHVFTSGGIGPTHDDVTYAAVGAAFGLPTAPCAAVLQRMAALQPEVDWTLPARARMAELPDPCELRWTDGLWVPTAVVGGNVYVLPGVPRLFRRMLDGLLPSLGGVGALDRRVIYTRRGEGTIAAPLAAVAADYPDVAIGSYPRVDGGGADGGGGGGAGDWRVRVTVEAEGGPGGVADAVAARVVAATGGVLGELDAAPPAAVVAAAGGGGGGGESA